MLFMIPALLLGLAENGVSSGPAIGCLEETGLCITARASGEIDLELRVLDGSGDVAWQQVLAASPEHDLCLHWSVDGLQPSTDYDYLVIDPAGGDRVVASGSFITQAPAGSRVPTTIAFASCAREDDGSAEVWTRMRQRGVDALVLLGDTPYIDTTDLARQRLRYRQFANVGPFAALVRNTPVYSTWDDHDFGANDTDGRLPGKENSRQAFLEHRPNSIPQGQQGIQTAFRVGDVEVFLLDARWHAGTEPSPFDASKPTLLGADQWAWLEAGLEASTAVFKVIATGMIFNDAVRPNKTDYWGNYPHERQALFDLVGELGLEGVVLVGGDVHRHRIVRHIDSRDAVGYELVEFISSPVHDQIIAAANAPHPGLVLDIGTGNIYLELTCETSGEAPVLVSRYVESSGRTLDVRRWPLSMLRAEADRGD
jgi:alkaline phosphatase D